MSVTPLRQGILTGETPPSVVLGSNNFFQYLVGAQTFHDPLTTRLVHGFKEVEGNEQAIIISSIDLVMGGLREAIRSGVISERRGGLAAEENKFVNHLPHLNQVVDYTYTQYADRVERLNPALMWLRPAPLLDRVTFRYICHSRMNKLTPKKLLPGIAIHSSLRNFDIDFFGA